jgi:hypothetical protein
MLKAEKITSVHHDAFSIGSPSVLAGRFSTNAFISWGCARKV